MDGFYRCDDCNTLGFCDRFLLMTQRNTNSKQKEYVRRSHQSIYLNRNQ